MVTGSLRVSRTDSNAWRMAAAGLLVAAVVVGLAVVVGGATARVVNPIGAFVWLISAVLLALSLPAAMRQIAGWVAAIAGGFLLGAVVRPGGIVEAVVAFAVAGAIVVVVAGDRSGGWALLVPAIYLPVHLAIGIGRAMLSDGGVRTDPPPTAAVVPLAMVLAAGLAGMVSASLLRREK